MGIYNGVKRVEGVMKVGPGVPCNLYVLSILDTLLIDSSFNHFIPTCLDHKPCMLTAFIPN